MRRFFPIFEIARWELRSQLLSAATYAVFALVISLCGLTAWYALKQQATVFKAQQLIFYILSGGLMVTGILITMKLLAEERSRGTLELLLTSPISEATIVLGKYLAAVYFLLITLALTLPATLSVLFLADGNVGQLIAGYLGAFCIGAAASAIGLFYSSLTNSQFIAALAAASNVIFFLLLGYFSPFIDPPLKQVIREFSLYVHYMNFEKGALVLKDILFFFSMVVFYLFLTRTSLEARRLS